jgi:hypothetical protein
MNARPSRVLAYWVYGRRRVFCVLCFQRRPDDGRWEEPGQALIDGDLRPGECCADCHRGLKPVS